jgi:hypothetical protein
MHRKIINVHTVATLYEDVNTRSSGSDRNRI